jgi:hypothetical protein
MPKLLFEPPGRPRLTVNIGITGHRTLPDANEFLLQEQLSDIFDETDRICQKIFASSDILYNDQVPLVRMLSPLAEGSDRIAAKCALNKGCELQCPLPFSRHEYMKDFITESSKAEFTELLSQATSVFEIDCDHGSRSMNYQQAGTIILGHSDVLIAIWNGEYTEKIGGTGDIVSKAAEQHVPVLWVNAVKDHQIVLLHEGGQYNNWQAELEKQLTNAFGTRPEPRAASEQQESAAELDSGLGSFTRLYLQEKRKKWNLACFHILFQNTIAGNFRNFGKAINLKADKHLRAARSGWDRQWEKWKEIPGDFKDFADRCYMPYYVWTEYLSSFYADHFRTAGLFRHLFYFLATVAYGFGLYFGFWRADNGDNESYTLIRRGIGFAFQALFLFAIIMVRKRNDKHKWHQKFIDYRILTELLRQTLYLAPLGTGIHGVNLPAYNRDANTNWINWYYRIILRQKGLPGMILNQTQLQQCRAMVMAILDDQITYHSNNTKKNKVIAGRLEKLGDVTYVVSLVFIVIRVFMAFIHAGYLNYDIFRAIRAESMKQVFHDIEKTLNYICLVLPALAAVAHAYADQGGFGRLEHRSEAMKEDLELAKERFEKIPEDSYSRVKTTAENIAYLMISEVSDWRVFVRSQELRNH